MATAATSCVSSEDPEVAYGEASVLLPKQSKNMHETVLSMLLSVAGPGLFACLADSDAGALFTYGDSGARWGFTFVVLLAALTPLIYMTQDLTVRLGVYTKKGLTACIRERYGPVVAGVTAFCLAFNCFFALASELSGIDAVVQLWGASRWTGSLGAGLILITALLTLTYKQVEVIGIVCGLSPLMFVASMLVLNVSPLQVLASGLELHVHSMDWWMLVAANIGATLMPWPLFFQQSAVAAAGLSGAKALADERKKTALGVIAAQTISISVVISVAATIHARRNLSGIVDFVKVLEPDLGHAMSKIMTSFAFLGASLASSFVVALTAAWAISEAFGMDDRCAMDRSVFEAPAFYSTLVAGVTLAVWLLFSGVKLVQLNIYIEMLNSFFLPFALMMIYSLASTDSLPSAERLAGPYKWFLAATFITVSVMGIASVGFSL
eukprot:TRINITY_DN9281_c0_g1_i1.p1 TRINITY_DN9281_c0_g1~~TRINITY_DN9281_c0_g1_i1.p1  ORF type:complete len:438 (+),score=70.18 TRINITY_DN9281_c0_g1_i1:85-1398(+)